jgi:CO/xanthine dehydrogenase Mo-binding subunit
VPNIDIESLCVYTNTLPRGNVRAPGVPQTVFALESHLDIIANELGIDPLDFRLRNVLEEGDIGPLGEKRRGINVKETLQAAANAIGWGSDKAPNIGRGIGLYERGPGGGPSNSDLTIDANAHLTLLTGVPDTGTGSHTVLQQIVAEELHTSLEAVTVIVGSTDVAPYDPGIGGSRVTHSAGQATLEAARNLRVALSELAAKFLECEPEEVIMVGDEFRANGRSLGLAELMERVGKLGEVPITRSGKYAPEGRPDVTSFCAQLAEVEIDLETGQVRIRQIVSAHDVGTIINPLTHQGQIDGGVVQGLGQTTIEDIQIEGGMVTTANLGDYKLPNIADVPELTTILIENKNGPAPYEGKAIGELANNAIVGAIANAVYDAVGVRLTDLPITAEKVYEALREKNGE